MEIRKGGIMNQNSIRYSLDMPQDMHMHLKMKATQKGISMREYILESLACKENIENMVEVDMDKETFKKAFEKVRKDYKQLAKNLSQR